MTAAMWFYRFRRHVVGAKFKAQTVIYFTRINLSTARPKWRLDGPALSGHLLYSLVNHA